MPTPMPIIATPCVVDSGIVSPLAVNCTSAMPVPIPASAVMIGKPAAKTEPKAISSTTNASMTPIASLAGVFWSPKSLPPSSIRRPETCTRAVSASTRSAASWNALSGRSAKLTSAYAIRPFVEICRAPSGEYGLTTCVRGTVRSMRANSCSIAGCTAGSATPWSLVYTIWPLSPAVSANPPGPRGTSAPACSPSPTTRTRCGTHHRRPRRRTKRRQETPPTRRGHASGGDNRYGQGASARGDLRLGEARDTGKRCDLARVHDRFCSSPSRRLPVSLEQAVELVDSFVVADLSEDVRDRRHVSEDVVQLAPEELVVELGMLGDVVHVLVLGVILEGGVEAIAGSRIDDEQQPAHRVVQPGQYPGQHPVPEPERAQVLPLNDLVEDEQMPLLVVLLGAAFDHGPVDPLRHPRAPRPLGDGPVRGPLPDLIGNAGEELEDAELQQAAAASVNNIDESEQQPRHEPVAGAWFVERPALSRPQVLATQSRRRGSHRLGW